MAKGKNSLEDILAEILRREKNSLEILAGLQEIYSSKNDKIIIEYTTDNDGTIESKEIQSHGFLMQEINRINDSIKGITGLDTLTSANIKLPDGSIKKIITSEVPIEPKEMKNIGKPLFFHKKNNKIADKLLDPLPTVKFDLTDKLNTDVVEVLVKKILVNADTTQAIDLFNTEMNGINLPYETITSKLNAAGITWDEYDERFRFSERKPKYSGTFNVQNIFKRDVVLVTDIETTTKKLVYKLDTLLYKDIENNSSDIVLKKGDEIIVNGDTRDTIYRIETVDTSNNEITVKRVQGYRSITVGVEKLIINPSFINKFELEVTININEYLICFFKPLNPNMGTVNLNWGDGIGMYTNDLLDYDNKAVDTKFINYYENYIDDSGKNLKSLTNEGFIPLSEAITPSTPELNVSDFVVTQINAHREDVKSTEDLRKKFSEKNKTKKDIEKLDASIEKQKTLIAVSDFKNDNERKNANKTLNNLMDERSGKVEQYNTLVDDLISRAKDIGDFKPKYKVRGFWNIPDPQYLDSTNKTGKQEIVQFITQYRYLRKDNTSTESDSFEFTKKTNIPQVSLTDTIQTVEEKQKATFSKWNQVESPRRKKFITKQESVIPTSDNTDAIVTIKTVSNEVENANDPDQVNINQLDISINPNENVEIRVRAVSEAGFPNSQSEWSESIIVTFPDELVNNVDAIGTDAQEEQARAKFLQELNAIGLTEHLSNSVEIGGDKFDHSAVRIATTFKTPENKPIDVNQKLIEQQAEIDALKALISAETAKMSVSITNSVGTEIGKITNNNTINIFAGYYNELTSGAAVPKGEIVSQLYYIDISNISDVVLELISYVSGLSSEPLPTSPTYDGYIINKDEYNSYRQYWKAPLSLRAITSDSSGFFDDKSTNPFIEIPTFQSGQSKGQLLYSRSRDISLNNKLYTLPSTIQEEVFRPTQSGGVPQTFIWDESATIATPNGNGNGTEFCVHVDHPDLDVNSEFMANFGILYDPITKLPPSSTNLSITETYYPQFTHSKYFNLQTTDIDGQLQLERKEYTLTSGTATENNFSRKFGFSKNDKYLIGSQTCGSYLYLAPSTHADLHTGSIIFNSGKQINKGSNNNIRIPFIYEFRMTDYFGAGSTGTGVLGGLGSPPLRNLSYTKKIGIDIQIKNQDLFSFDIKVEAQYKLKSVADAAAR
jgi:hypothetical protein